MNPNPAFAWKTSWRRFSVGIFLLVLALVLGGVIWHSWLQDRLIPKRWGVVEQGYIYRSAQLRPTLLKKALNRYRIQRIVDLTLPDPADAVQAAEKEIAADLGVEYLNYPLYGSGIGEIWNYAYAMAVMASAKKDEKPVLVHCFAGTQRTGGVIAAYRLLIEKRPAADVYAELIRYDWNPKKDRILSEFLNSHMAELADRLLEMRLIDTIPDPLPFLGP